MTDLPSYSDEALRDELSRRAPRPLSSQHLNRLVAHYRELARWSPRLALVGQGTGDEVLDRHYGESLAGLGLLPESWQGPLRLLDVGSGAGFPGFVLAAASNGIEPTFVEPRRRKQTFLKSACRKAALPCYCPDARVELPWPSNLPREFDLVTSRALRLGADMWAELARRLTPEGRMLLWVGKDDPDLPVTVVVHRSLSLPGSDHRRILDLRAT